MLKNITIWIIVTIALPIFTEVLYNIDNWSDTQIVQVTKENYDITAIFDWFDLADDEKYTSDDIVD